MKGLFLFAVSFTMLFCSCYYDKEEQLYPKVTAKTCDTVNVNFQKNIEPVINNYCVTCHGSNAAGGIDLSSYDLVKAKADAIYNTISHSSGFSPMPKNSGKLDNCKITMFRKWREAGMPY